MAENSKRDTSGAGDGNGGFEVGYGKPPKHSQFKSGERRNPRGRPRGPSAKALLRGKLEEKVKVREGKKVRTMTKAEVGLTKMVNRFVETGGLKSFQFFHNLVPDLLGGAAGTVFQQLVDEQPRPHTADVLTWYRARILEQNAGGLGANIGRRSDDDVE